MHFTIGATTNPIRFVGGLGYYFDSDLIVYFVRTRPLTPLLGRWISRDPAGFEDGLNQYLYVLNNPIVAIDPSGLKICTLPPDTLLALMKEFLGIAGWTDKDGRVSLATVACVACQESNYDPGQETGSGLVLGQLLTRAPGHA